MFLDCKIIVETPWLGDVLNQEKQIREFRKESTNAILICTKFWKDVLAKCAVDLNYENFDKTKVLLQRQIGLQNAKIEIITRVYNQVKKERFEALGKGCELNLAFVYDDCIDNVNERAFLKEAIFKMLDHAGQFYGLSPWGSKFGYGRFKIEHN
jgi:hypothetical protein